MLYSLQRLDIYVVSNQNAWNRRWTRLYAMARLKTAPLTRQTSEKMINNLCAWLKMTSASPWPHDASPMTSSCTSATTKRGQHSVRSGHVYKNPKLWKYCVCNVQIMSYCTLVRLKNVNIQQGISLSTTNYRHWKPHQFQDDGRLA